MITETGEIICHTTPWYTKRRLLMVAMLLGFSAYFAYDWKIGYPKERIKYGDYWPAYEKAQKEENLKAYTDMAVEKGWPKEPHQKDWDYKLKEQLIWCIGTGIGGLVLLGAWLRNRARTLRADHESFTTPDGTRILFASVVKVDKRKWDNKALAYVYWKPGSGEGTKKATIDDLVFDDAGKVFDRLIASFNGELIDIERPDKTGDPDDADPVPESGPAGSATPAAEIPTPSRDA